MKFRIEKIFFSNTENKQHLYWKMKKKVEFYFSLVVVLVLPNYDVDDDDDSIFDNNNNVFVVWETEYSLWFNSLILLYYIYIKQIVANMITSGFVCFWVENFSKNSINRIELNWDEWMNESEIFFFSCHVMLFLLLTYIQYY